MILEVTSWWIFTLRNRAHSKIENTLILSACNNNMGWKADILKDVKKAIHHLANIGLTQKENSWRVANLSGNCQQDFKDNIR